MKLCIVNCFIILHNVLLHWLFARKRERESVHVYVWTRSIILNLCIQIAIGVCHGTMGIWEKFYNYCIIMPLACWRSCVDKFKVLFVYFSKILQIQNRFFSIVNWNFQKPVPRFLQISLIPKTSKFFRNRFNF